MKRAGTRGLLPACSGRALPAPRCWPRPRPRRRARQRRRRWSGARARPRGSACSRSGPPSWRAAAAGAPAAHAARPHMAAPRPAPMLAGAPHAESRHTAGRGRGALHGVRTRATITSVTPSRLHALRRGTQVGARPPQHRCGAPPICGRRAGAAERTLTPPGAARRGGAPPAARRRA